LIGSFVALFFPQKIAGVIYRLGKELERVKNGDLTVYIRLRRTDKFTRPAEIINETIAGLREIILEIKEASKEVEKEVEKGNIEKIKENFLKLKEKLNKIKT